MPLDHDTSLPASNKTISKSAPSKKRSHSEYLLDINSRFKRLTEDVFPHHPYLLTVPTEKPFRLGSRTVTNWAVGKGCLFAPEEEQLQYMTFLSRQAEDTLLVAVGGWSDGNGNIIEEDEPRIHAVKMRNNPSQNSQQKKKISFKDYKKALETSVPPTPALGSSNKTEPSPLKQDVPSNRRGQCPKASTSTKEDVAPKRRPESPSSKPVDESSPPHRKKPRSEKDSEEDSDKPLIQLKKPPAVPELLSPTLPPDTTGPSIPPLLSPTLPPELEEEISLSEESKKAPPSAARKSLPKPTGSHSDATKSKSIERNRPREDSFSSTKGDTKLKTPNTSFAAKPGVKSSPIPAPLTNRPIKKVTVTAQGSVVPSSSAGRSAPATPAKPRLVVRLKYGRQNRKRIEALLKITRRKAPAEKRPAKPQEDVLDQKEIKPPSTLKAPEKQRESSLGSKRPPPIDDIPSEGPARKKPKATAPTSSEPKGTPNSKTSGQQPKAQFPTPKKEVKPGTKGTSMRRTESTDSEAKPSIAKAAGALDERPTSKASPALSTDNQSTKSHDAEWRAWRDEWQKYKDLGRELKHASDPLADQGRSGGSQSRDAKLSAATAIEAVLCFSLAFIADDKSKSLSRQTRQSSNWHSLIPYWQAVAHRTAAYPHLHGLCLLLGAIIYEAVHTLDLDRLASIALPGEPSNSHNSNQKNKAVAPTPGSDDADISSQPSTLAQDSKVIRELIDLRNRLPQSHRESNRLWLEGCRLLPDVILAREYPMTWQRRSRNFAERGREVLKVGKYSGDFFLPMPRSGGMAPGTGTTGVIEGIRFATVFMREWCEKEDVRWINKLKL
ncbi:uncharacterized protein CIMG_02547 [Coccidioides immitis RS]|uniref:Ell binding protein Ebp1 C-terminal domain-containing protein n=2 Tax=Coccidioides immitis TaxID=5501 RepID=A0A0E1S0W2_COCIM|nr:uncharacterized protein CIMG_02547 [Coccidioides immitis RS]EAS37193.1 hypothetical protein CIMG_02547 [Coccidioides immitis RS]KMP10141.1 hypothetical protein CIRG_09374 [Coccidioides immitis RMSCC 2394]TPX24806.1 hypothetical protein DIZ76_010249 [Coccidioides immitis]